MQAKDTFFSRKSTINCNGELIDLSEPKVMGILNITPDSFYDGGKYSSLGKIINQATEMIENGCDILYVDHHFSGEIPDFQNLTAHIDSNPETCK